MQVVQGSKEYLVVDLQDLTGLVSDLAALGVQFDVNAEDGTPKQSNVAAAVTGMRAACLVDTTAGGA